MAITAADIKFYLSGGAANADPNVSLGGARSNTEMGAGLQNLFDNVIGGEAAAGSVEYRCFYVRNEHATITWETVMNWISQLTTNVNSEIDIGLDPAAVNAVATTVANETTAPAGVVFTRPTSKPGGLARGNVVALGFYAVWVRRTVSAGAVVDNNDNGIFRAEGDTAA